MSQPSLFDKPPAHCLSRRDDKQTSKLAAEEVGGKLTALQDKFMLALRALKVPATAAEIARQAALTFCGNQESYRKRSAECVRLGAIKEHDRRKCEVTGKL